MVKRRMIKHLRDQEICAKRSVWLKRLYLLDLVVRVKASSHCAIFDCDLFLLVMDCIGADEFVAVA